MPSDADSTVDDARRRCDRAFGAAIEFVHWTSILAHKARGFDPNAPRYSPGTFGHVTGRDEEELEEGLPRLPHDWSEWGAIFAPAFIAWFDLDHLATGDVRLWAQQTHLPGSATIRLGKSRLKPSYIEAVKDELGVYFRNVLYHGRSHPLEPDRGRLAEEAKALAIARQVARDKPAEPFGMGRDFEKLLAKETREVIFARLGLKTWADVIMLMVREWQSQPSNGAESVLHFLKCGSVDFDDLEVQLRREAAAVLAALDREQAMRNALDRPDKKHIEVKHPRESLRIIRPVPTAEAALWADTRSDFLLSKLKRAHYPVGGTQRKPVADLDHIIECYPGKARKLRKWADQEYPPDEPANPENE